MMYISKIFDLKGEDMDQEKIAKTFKALCDVKRIAILELLKSGEKCACEITEELNIAQSALSYHMKILCESGIVESWYIGKWTHYRISEDGVQYASAILSQLLDKEETTKHCSCQ